MPRAAFMPVDTLLDGQPIYPIGPIIGQPPAPVAVPPAAPRVQSYRKIPVYQELCQIYDRPLGFIELKAIANLLSGMRTLPFRDPRNISDAVSLIQNILGKTGGGLPSLEDVIGEAERIRDYYKKHDQDNVAQRLGDFNFKQSEAWRALSEKLSDGVTLSELKSIAAVASQLARISEPDREAKRRLPLMVKWFEDNWTAIGPHLPAINLKDHTDLSGRANRRQRFAQAFVPEE
ncbi:MAG: hypothetical protein LBL30_00220 [Holosporales bacterium]|nr:hypothetical protein [Holosporales bacterium]